MIMESRRNLCKALALSPLWAPAMASAADKKLRVAILFSGFESVYVDPGESFVAGLRELGYVEGKNLTVDRRYGNLRGDQLPGIAREMVALRPDVIVTGCTGSSRVPRCKPPSRFQS